MGKSIKLPKVPVPKIKIGKDLGLKAVGKAVGNVATAATKAVKDTGVAVTKGVGDTVSQVGRTVKDKGTIQAGKNITRESKKGMEIAAPILTQLAGNALTGGAYGAISSLGNMAQSGKFDLGQATSAVGSLAGFSPTMMQALQGGTALAKGDLKGAALAGLGSLGSSGGQSFLSSFAGGGAGGAGGNPFLSALTNPNALRLASSAISGDKKGLVSGLAGYAGFGDNTSNLIGSLAANDKKGIASSLGGALGFGEDMSRAIGGAVTGDARNIAMGLLGAGNSEYGFMDPNRLKALDALSGGKLTMQNAQTAFGGLLPSMGGGADGESEGGGSSWLKSIQDLGAGFSTGDLTPDALKGLSTSGLLPFSTSGLLPSVSGMLPQGLSTSGLLPDMGFDLGAGGKGSENTAAVKDFFSNMFGGGDGSQAGRVPAGEQMPEEQGFFDQATDAVGDFVGGNRDALKLGLGAAGSYAMYDQWKKRWEERRKITGQQKEELEAAGKDYQAMKFDPTRYQDYRKFLEDRIAGKGIGAEEKKLQQEGDIRAGRAGAGARAAALEQMARTMGGAGGGSGAALAAALSGGQSVMDIQSQTNLQREASAQENLEKALSKKSELSSLSTKEEADLAAQQARYRLDQLDKIAEQRKYQKDLQKEIGLAEGTGLSSIAKLGQQALDMYESPQERERRKQAQEQQRRMSAVEAQRKQEEEAYQRELRQAQLDKTRAEAEALRRGQTGQQTTPPPPAQQTTPPPAQQTTPPPATSKPPQQAGVPTPKPPPKPLPAPGPTQSQISSALNRGSYVIRQGDSLSKRYKELGYGSVKEAYEANKDLIGDNMNLIKTGQTLRRKDEVGDKRVSTPVQDMNKKYSGGNIA